MIHSVDSLKLAEEINRCAAQPIDVLIEVNIASEQSKHGVIPEMLGELAEHISGLEQLRLRGLMVIPPYGDSVRYFERTRRLYEDLRAKYAGIDTLSMGMSGDYEAAVECGSTIVRLGNALFGNRIL
jgi:hypothetical protein